MANSPLDFPNTDGFRTRLVTRNLAPYPKSPRRVQPPINYAIVQSDYSVIDSPDSLIDQPTFANQLYPLNQYGSQGGYVQVRDPNTLQNTNSNEGEYGVQDANIIQQASVFSREWKPLNPYGNGPALVDSAVGIGSRDVLIINSTNTSNAQPYPTTFVASFYNPVNILLSNNPRGSNGSLSQDSFIAKLGARVLRREFEERIAREIRRRTLGRINVLNANTGSPIIGLINGSVPLIQPNYQITVLANPVTAAADLALRLAGTYFPVSPIPGSYFDPSINPGQPTTIQQLQNAYRDTVGQTVFGQVVGALLGAGKTGSQLFLNNTGAGQKSRLFYSLDFNKFKPEYDRNVIERVAGVLFPSLTNNSNYYVGSITSEPSRIFSPSGDLPINEFNQEVQAPVYGATELAQLYEGEVSKQIKLGASAPSYINGGGIEGGTTWVSPKFKGNAGKKVGVGGEIIKDDPDYKESTFTSSQSTNLRFTQGSILDETQRIIDSQPRGGKRLQHVGNAIDQVSKVFNDGYKEITKGSKVLAYIGEIGQEKGAEYCRIFTKDTPYLQYNDLQKTDGMTTEGRRFSYSVLDKTYNLNIVPNKREGGQDSTNLIGGGGESGHVKKYMFSLENLAWRTSNRPGYTVSDLPVCERGPNGGRIMWFPPYDLKFTESVSSNWKATDFLGRPEPVYTYNNTSRSGTLNWKIVVDHPSTLNIIVNKILEKETNKQRIDSIIDSFFAGCRKYDLYELAKKYYTVNPNDIFEIQKEIQYRESSVERIRYLKKELTTGEDGTSDTVSKTNPPTEDIDKLNTFRNKAVYFPNDVPGKTQTNSNYNADYAVYQGQINSDPAYNGDTQVFFSTVVESNYNYLKNELKPLVEKLLTNFSQGNVKVKIDGSASAPASVTYNDALSNRRITSFKNFLRELIPNPRFLIEDGKGEGENANVELFNAQKGSFEAGNTYSCSDKDGGDGSGKSKEIYTVNAMACRRAIISSIEQTLEQSEVIKGKESTKKTELVDVPESYQENERIPEEVTRTVIRDNISKRILRSLLSECDYFEVIKEETPMVYDNLRDKLKFFNPAFHSITPEGLNARLTFLQQCMRPGDTIPIIQKDGQLQYTNATNTAFGAPPVLVLRVGDFFHTKIIPDSLQLSYEGLDLNPEGIGVQPMIATVSLSFKFVGGQGLASAVDKLQNALSFNYYANTEMYDDRADVTDTSYKVIDKELLDYFNIQVPPATVNQVQQPNASPANGTIGTITSTSATTDGEFGTINYQVYMNKFIDNTQTYFNTVLNKNKEVFKQYNNAIRQIWTSERNYTEGTMNFDSASEVRIVGKPKNLESRINKIFDDFISNVKNENEGLIEFIKGSPSKGFSDKVIRALKDNYVKYLNEKKNSFISALTTITQQLVTVEQNWINTVAQNNVVLQGVPANETGTDGVKQSTGFVKIYVISGTSNISDTQKYTNQTTYDELKGDTTIIRDNVKDFTNLTESTIDFRSSLKDFKGLLIYGKGNPAPSDVFDAFTIELGDDVILKRSYTLLSQDILDSTKYQTFRQALIGNIINNSSVLGSGRSDIQTEFDGYWNQATVKGVFQSENKITEDFFNFLETDKLKTYLKYDPFNLARTKKYEFTFTTDPLVEPGEAPQRKLIIEALSTPNNQNSSTEYWSQLIGQLVICKVKLN